MSSGYSAPAMFSTIIPRSPKAVCAAQLQYYNNNIINHYPMTVTINSRSRPRIKTQTRTLPPALGPKWLAVPSAEDIHYILCILSHTIPYYIIMLRSLTVLYIYICIMYRNVYNYYCLLCPGRSVGKRVYLFTHTGILHTIILYIYTVRYRGYIKGISGRDGYCQSKIDVT